MFELIVSEVREVLKEHGWRLFLYPHLDILNIHNSAALCDEESKRILIATKGLSKKDILWFLAHEFAHFHQMTSGPRTRQCKVDWAYNLYSNLTDRQQPIPKSKIKRVRALILNYEYEADRRAFKILNQWGVETKGFKKDANSYNYVIKYAFCSGKLINYKRTLISEGLSILDKWFTNQQKQQALTASQLKFLHRHYKRYEDKMPRLRYS